MVVEEKSWALIVDFREVRMDWYLGEFRERFWRGAVRIVQRIWDF